MNKTYQYTLTAHEKKEISFETGVARLAIANGDGVDGSTIVVMDEITKQHSGDLVSFIDGADAPFADFNVGIVAVQSGTGDPSPENERPISGWTGANIYVNNKNFVNIADSTISAAGYVLYNVAINVPKGDFVLSFNFSGTTGSSASIRFDNENGNAIYTTSKTITIGKNAINVTLDTKASYIKIYSQSIGTYSNFQIEKGSQATDYVAQSQIITNIDWEDEAGTVYGGYIKPLTGELVVTHAKCIIPDNLHFNQATWANNQYYSQEYIFNDETYMPKAVLPIDNGHAISLTTSKGNYNIPYNSLDTGYGISITTDGRIGFSENMIDYIVGTEIVYPLATPVTYQLTPTEIRSLLGLNEVWADCGPVDVRYFVQSTQPMIDYIDEKTIVYFDAQEDFSTYDISLIGATSTDVKNCLKTNKNANIVIRVKRYSTIELFYLREYSPNYFADFASHAVIFDAEGTKSMRIDYLRLDLTQETTDFTDDYIILPTA